MAWYKVANPAKTAAPFLRKVMVGGKGICLVNTGEQVFALSATCPHAGADLSKGWCEGGKLVCPFHRYAYDLETGRGAPGQHDFVHIYAVEVRPDGIYVEVNNWLQKLKDNLGL